MARTAIIIGAGPAGLTAAYELLARTDIRPIVLEQSALVGGLSRTECYKGNRIDIGGHRFFSKSDRVMRWWLEMLPLEAGAPRDALLQYQGRTGGLPEEGARARGREGASEQGREGASESERPGALRPCAPPGALRPGALPGALHTSERVMLIRQRRSRIYFLRRFFDYPLSLSARTLRNLGLVRVVRIGLSYARARLWPIRPETNLEQFFINRFGRELYRTFFQSYTEKVWGVPCERISAAWGAQRVKGLSITRALLHALRKPFGRLRAGFRSAAAGAAADVAQKRTETSLIEQFLYPKLGPGQMWETVAEHIVQMGGEIRRNVSVQRLLTSSASAANEADAAPRLTGVETVDSATGASATMHADFVFSTMPIRDLIRGLDTDVPAPIRAISDGLVYRDFITVGLIVKKMRTDQIGNAAADACETLVGGAFEDCAAPEREGAESKSENRKSKILPDNWIYIQEPDVRVGRVQIFNNWSPYLVADPAQAWLGLEYFCDEGDDLWQLSDGEMLALGRRELAQIGLIEADAVLDGTVIRVPKTYPAYFGTYDRFDELRAWLDRFANLYLLGRNGMHKYNNQDHSMLTAMTAVDNLVAGRVDKANIWAVNAEQEYHEEK